MIREQLLQLTPDDETKVEVTVENMTDNDVVFCSTLLGWLHSVEAIYPSQAKCMESQLTQSLVHSVSPPVESSQITPAEPWDPPVDLSHVTSEQQLQVKQMLREECDVFAKDDWDTGCIKDLELDIQLKDNVPVQKTNNAIPRHL